MADLTPMRGIAERLAQKGVDAGIISHGLKLPYAQVQGWLEQIGSRKAEVTAPHWSDCVQTIMIVLHLARQQAIVLAMLLEHEVVSVEQLRAEISPASPKPRIVDVIVRRLRTNLEPFGVVISNRKLLGFYLRPADKRVIRERLKQGLA
jgi:hypothetical protein